MAIQAQYSSNIHLLNRTLQEENKTQIGINHWFPPQHNSGGVTTGALDHQSLNHTLFNNFPGGNCNTNPRKRGREDIMNQFISNTHKKQSHCKQLTGVHNESRNIDVSTGLRLAFNHHHHQQHPYAYIPQLSEDLSTLINQQEDEIERYLQAQGEELRRKLADKQQRHYSALIGAATEVASRMIREKEAVAEKAARRNAELEARLSELMTEAHVWQSKARAEEAVAVALQAQLQQAAVAGAGGCVSPEVVVVGGGEAEDAESSYVDPERVVVVSGPGCKACGKRVASVVLLPCRHLCVCTECDDVVQACPLCLSFRSSSIEVYLS